MRLFVCALLDEANQAFYGERMARVIENHASLLRPIPHASAHVTLTFMNAIPDDELRNVLAACAEATTNVRSFEAVLGTPFVLYGGSEARLVCAPVIKGTDRLAALEARLGTVLTALYPGDRVKRTKSFHVTLARFRKHLRRNAARAVDAELREASPAVWTRRQVMEQIEIVSSELRPGGPVYATQSVIPLSQ